jgi:CO dehydrogenase maturation factor
MKIAVAGKGGSGKTTIAGTLARVMADRGQRVVAIDDDSNPNLALTLGARTVSTAGLPRDMLEERTDAAGNKRLELSIPADDFIERFGVRVGDSLTLLVMGQPNHGGSG